MVIMIIKMGSLVKDGELTETPDSDFPDRRRHLAQGAVKRHLEQTRSAKCVGFYILSTSQVSSLMLKPTLVALGSPESSNVN